jgi:hypothetical protein
MIYARTVDSSHVCMAKSQTIARAGLADSKLYLYRQHLTVDFYVRYFKNNKLTLQSNE